MELLCGAVAGGGREPAALSIEAWQKWRRYGSGNGGWRRAERRRRLVTEDTSPRAIRYVGSCLPLRAGSGGLCVAQGGLAHPHRPVLTSTSAVVDIHIGRYRHRHRPVCIAPDGLHVAARGGGASICLRPFSCGLQSLRGRHNSLFRCKKSAFCLVLSPTWTTFAPY